MQGAIGILWDYVGFMWLVQDVYRRPMLAEVLFPKVSLHMIHDVSYQLRKSPEFGSTKP